MMATEVNAQNIATSSTIHDHELNTPEIKSQDVSSDLHQPLLNGTSEKDESKQPTESTGSGGISASASVNGGSDTEASKAEGSKTGEDEKGHTRTGSSVKKIATFKSVSVNKTFLAAKTPPPSKLGDKATGGTSAAPAGPSTTSNPRPRLVAKSGSGLRDSAPRNSTSANGGKAGGAPDGNVVWNKNRPAPPPEPKRMTDEELKQQYGIHLATRLQSDDPGKQANWADIDDDDDDWAPETIEWTDGTKITLPQADETPAREPTPAPEVKEAKPVEIAKPKSPAPPQAAASPSVKPSGFGGRAGLVLKGAAEKPTLVAKPPGPPTPVKSPWAPLPPVDKVPPVVIDIPVQQTQQSRFSQRDPHGFQSMPAPPAKEIAADDFSRSWREGQANTSRELYNSQSGRYEPVNDRRGSRNEHHRQPAVLQRPPQQDGPAEPSPAFQTHRHDSSFNRRRTSSNLSGGSGHFARRMSKGDIPPPHDMLNVRRGSLAAVSDTPSSPRNFSPSGQFPRGHQNQNQVWQPRAPNPNPPTQQATHGPTTPAVDNQPPVIFEDPVEAQKKIMRETRELAIKRRQEEEAREEAAKQERIRLKLEAMGPPPEKKKDKKEPSKQEISVPTQIQSRVTAEANVHLKPEQEAHAETKARSPNTVEQKPSGPAVSKSTSVTPSDPDVRANGLQPSPSGPPTGSVPQDNRASQPWQNQTSGTPERYQPWAPPPNQSSTRGNVWGPPSSDRTLGNGTFNPELSRISDIQASASRPGPIGPPRGNSQYQQGRGHYGSRPAPIGPPSRQPASLSPTQAQRIAASGWADLPEKLVREDNIAAQQAEAERWRRRDLEEQGVIEDVAQPQIKETWRKVSLASDGTRNAVKEKVSTTYDGATPWKLQEDAGQRPVLEEHHPEPVQHASDIVQPRFSNTWKTDVVAPSSSGRTSKFFPTGSRDVQTDGTNVAFPRSQSPSPPPPDTIQAGHPVFDGDAMHPHVSLPGPQPVVKLPPSNLPPVAPPKPASFASVVTGPTINSQVRPQYSRPSQDIRNEPSHGNRISGPPNGWQQKFNQLLDHSEKRTSKPSAVDSLSKNALELPNPQFAATVSLPSSVSGDLVADEGSVYSKPPAESCFEEQEMGSLPVIKVPTSAPELAWSPAPPPKINKKHNSLNIVSVNTFAADDEEVKQQAKFGLTVIIKIPGQTDEKSITVPPKRQVSNGRPRGGQRGNRANARHSRGGRGRDSSGAFSPSNTESPGSSSRGGRGFGGSNNDGTTGSHTRGRGNRRGNEAGSSYDWSKYPAPAPINA
ncbi:hypothetical protein B0O99DRAFT_128035 [Bisporella sp. PMI_857]|nr:hypothetical protein B0O99DRAFT_128035 [Bisporella sp. PMI_857]